MKIFLLKGNENWICDRFVEEWYEYNSEFASNNPHEADILWLVSSWLWNHMPYNLLEAKKVITTIHHIDQTKVDDAYLQNFFQRDKITNMYHVPCEKTKEILQKLTNKEIFVQPFWANQNIWRQIEDRNSLKREFNFPLNKTLIGSFQRDTEGHDLKSPKLSKGPDIFCDIIEKMDNVEVVLAGWRRQYIINRLEEANIKYHYFEWASFELLNKLYNCLDLYIVSSRCEGGPQAIVECALAKTPIISTDVGITDLILDKDSIYNFNNINNLKAKPNISVAYENVQKYKIPNGFKPFNSHFNTL